MDEGGPDAGDDWRGLDAREDGFGPAAPPSSSGAASGAERVSARTHRVTEEHVKFEAARPANASAVRDTSARFRDNLNANAAACKASREAEMKKDFCACCRAGHNADSIVPVPDGTSVTVRVFNVSWQYEFVLQELMCAVCKTRRMPTAHDILCYASQAEACQTGSLLFTRELLEHTKSLVFRGGTSFTALADCFSIPASSVEAYIRAWFEYLKCVDVMDLPALGVTGTDRGPFAHCPVCAKAMANGADAPASVQDRLKISLCLMTDASNTPDRLQCGKASQAIQPSLSTFIGVRHQIVSEALAASRSAPPSSSRVAQDADTSQVPVCGPGHDYTCARVDPTLGSVKASEGVMGCVCKHGIGLLEAFASMDGTHECYIFYDVILEGILLARPDLKFINLDFGCKYGAHFHGPNFCKLLPEGTKLPLDIRQAVTVKVPYLHGQSHVVACRLEHGGLFAEGSGWMYGEQTEQLWGQSKPWSHIIRNMTHAHRIDFINLGLAWMARRKAENIFPSLRDQREAMIKKRAKMLGILTECAKAYDEVHNCGIDAARTAITARVASLTAQQKASAATAALEAAARLANFDVCQSQLALSIVKVTTLESQFTPDGSKRHAIFFPGGSRPSDITSERSGQSTLIVRHQDSLANLGWLLPGEATLKPFGQLSSLPSFEAAYISAKLSAIKVIG